MLFNVFLFFVLTNCFKVLCMLDKKEYYKFILQHAFKVKPTYYVISKETIMPGIRNLISAPSDGTEPHLEPTYRLDLSVDLEVSYLEPIAELKINNQWFYYWRDALWIISKSMSALHPSESKSPNKTIYIFKVCDDINEEPLIGNSNE